MVIMQQCQNLSTTPGGRIHFASQVITLNFTVVFVPEFVEHKKITASERFDRSEIMHSILRKEP